MKKEYIKPEMLVVVLQQQGCLLAGSKGGAPDHLVKDVARGDGTDKIFDFSDEDFDDEAIIR